MQRSENNLAPASVRRRHLNVTYAPGLIVRPEMLSILYLEINALLNSVFMDPLNSL